MSLGLPDIDGEHRRLVLMLDRVCVALGGRNTGQAVEALGAFNDAMTQHFAAECRILSGLARYQPSQADHMACHAVARERVASLATVLNSGDLDAADAIAADLVDFWIRRLFREEPDLARLMRRDPFDP